MPLFDFVCDACGCERIDAILPNKDVPVPCPADINHGPMRYVQKASHFGGFVENTKESNMSRAIKRAQAAEQREIKGG